MALFKCKMCGGELDIAADSGIMVCEYCGSKQTLPKLDTDKKVNRYGRANHFRRNNEYDKAMSIYEQLLDEDDTDAETYWSLVLCRYGIEYVEDPATHTRIPTVNRTQFTSVFDDEDYKSAIKYATAEQRTVYEAEAAAINEIQKGILAISQKEDPFDIFICYKETDVSGRRTPDSVLAQDLYYQLKREGFKVFFSRITLEDKLGSAYEPYIFAALNSAKVMVVLGTRPEHFNATWVKNEWGRYLALIKSGTDKMIIPAYKDMDPYDIPDELSHLQAQDMSKLGFMQDLIHGIKKIVKTRESVSNSPKQQTTSAPTAPVANISPLLKRAFMFLEDGDWNSADEYCEKVLDQDPENAQAYLGKMMAELKVKTQAELSEQQEPFDKNRNYQKIIRFGDEKTKAFLTDCIKFINERNENARLEGIYSDAVSMMTKATTDAMFLAAALKFERIPNYKNSAQLAKKCREKAEIAKKDTAYNTACQVLTTTSLKKSSILPLYDAITIFESLNGWRDSEEKIVLCRQKIEEINQHLEQARIAAEQKQIEARRMAELKAKERAKKSKRNKIITAVVLLTIIAVIIASIIIYNVAQYHKTYGFGDYKQYIIDHDVTEVVIPYGVTSIESYAFSDCSSLTSITIPNSVTSIESYAFSGCSRLTSITIPDSVTSISYCAFYNCSSLTSVTIPDSVTRIESGTFYGCTSLKKIIFNSTISQWENIRKSSNWNYNTGNYTIYCTDGTISK